ncbi:MAG TPA: hypothetical protein VK653_16485 [Xanthobacteraceae bacterium]|nr:hypothetical protein [Xanthobacteraceae bacterium]
MTFVYGMQEDRILAAINPGRPDAWSCWLTRRVTLLLLDRITELLANTSSLTQRTPAPLRGEVMAFEHAAAMAKTAERMSHTPADVLNASTATAELVKSMTLTNQGELFRIELTGLNGGGAKGVLARVGLQRVLQMLQDEVTKARWLTTERAQTALLAADEQSSAPRRH